MNQLFSVRGQAAIVTGAASGLGLAIAEALASGGARVTLLDLNGAAVERETGRLRQAGLEVRAAALDVSDRQALDTAFDAAAAAHGGLDIVFANAGIDPGPGFVSVAHRGTRVPEQQIENYSDERWHKVVGISLDAAFYSIRAAARLMKPAGRGSIIVTTSISAVRPAPAVGMAYMAAKAGAAHLVRTCALELARYGIRVNAIAPGPFATNISADRADAADFRAAQTAAVPLGRVAAPEEIQGLALLLASGASGFITGEQIVIDGGASLGAAC
ncbi:Gluconate 5-dehydrogenase (plasmid) [Variovorax sp. SRS16]|uniref:SDR family NAD(P)-dependent oxidoreductase n=1 Tax=Variovorax sp. SRS16 TaxID=282217 RepID=UPI0013160D54|nr:SDR family NAD(P)-dependent oxidoreductase [Variovorax sp. SRS16]VTU46341.1 Gluconate 5-dehydrogenase [Variovorax sp. SRS16]